VQTKGQSTVYARYVDAATNRDIKDPGEPIAGWPKGSDENKDGQDKATVSAQVVKGWVLTKTPSGAGPAKEYKVTAEFPAEGKNTAIIYGYTKMGKYVSDETLAKGFSNTRILMR
jgi:hypothetical protein